MKRRERLYRYCSLAVRTGVAVVLGRLMLKVDEEEEVDEEAEEIDKAVVSPSWLLLPSSIAPASAESFFFRGLYLMRGMQGKERRQHLSSLLLFWRILEEEITVSQNQSIPIATHGTKLAINISHSTSI